MKLSHSVPAGLIRFIAWSLIIVPFIVATTFSPLHFLAMLTNAAAHATRSGDIVVGWVSDTYDFVAPVSTIFRSSTRQQARGKVPPAGRVSGRGQARR
jgi:hypothetical protein